MREGDTLYKIGQMYNVNYEKIASDNKIPLHQILVVGQTIVILTGETNQVRQMDVNGYAFPNIDVGILEDVLPSLTYLSIFSYSVVNDGSLRPIDDDKLISMAKDHKVIPVMVITNIGEEGRFSSDLAHQILIDDTIQDKLIANVFSTMYKKGYGGLDIDFEYVYPEDRDLFINFIKKVKNEIEKRDSFLVVALAPKYSDEQKGVLYEAHDYKRIGELADHVIIMTYEWGYSRGEARAVSPLNLVQRVLDYAVTRIPPAKILMGIPNYGYDWTLPFTAGSLATSIGNYDAVNIARNNNQSIKYDPVAQAPYFNYTDASGARHEVWFEDARSIQAKLELVTKYNLEGISYWTLNRFFPQNYLVLNSLFTINKYL